MTALNMQTAVSMSCGEASIEGIKIFMILRIDVSEIPGMQLEFHLWFSSNIHMKLETYCSVEGSSTFLLLMSLTLKSGYKCSFLPMAYRIDAKSSRIEHNLAWFDSIRQK
jgi:hypothetical protein